MFIAGSTPDSCETEITSRLHGLRGFPPVSQIRVRALWPSFVWAVVCCDLGDLCLHLFNDSVMSGFRMFPGLVSKCSEAVRGISEAHRDGVTAGSIPILKCAKA